MKEHGNYMYEVLSDDKDKFFYAIYSYKQGPRCRFKTDTILSNEYFSSEIEGYNKALEEIKSLENKDIDLDRQLKKLYSQLPGSWFVEDKLVTE